MDFKSFCDFLEEIQKTSAQADKHQTIRTKFRKLRQDLNNEDEFYQILRLMVPKMDRERDSYNMKEAKLARTFIKMLGLPAGYDRNVLNNSSLMAAKAGDFGDVVYSVIRKYLRNHTTTLSIAEINEFLDNLTKVKGDSEAEQLLMKLFKRMSPDHTRWIVRIILKDLKLGISQNSILNCYHPDATAFYNSNNNLKKVCATLRDENIRMHELEIQIFEPFRPMLSKRIDTVNFHKELPDNKLFYLENKFDGERFQVHMKNGEFKYFSRNGFDYTENLGKSFTTGLFTPKLRGLFDDSVRSVILDGELMLWHKIKKQFGSKGMTLDVKKLNSLGPYQPCFCAYDILLFNDKILTNVPFKERVKTLRQVFKSFKDGVVCVSDIKEVNSQQEIIDELNAAVEREDEGIIIKKPDSIYKYSDRKGGWYKMKLEYFQGVMNDLDLVVMGAIYASSTSKVLNSFIMGIRSGTADNGKPLYISIGKVASGLSDQQLDVLNTKLKTEGKQFKNFDSKNLIFGKEQPDYYVEPEKSVVFQIRATELIRNMDSSFRAAYTLRFPRVVQIRDDKPVDECLTINELMELTKSNKSVIKLNKRSIELSEIVKTKVRRVNKKEIEMIEVYNKTVVSDILENYNIFVLNGVPEFSKEKAENFIKKAKGTVSYILKDAVDIILVGQKTGKVKELIKKKGTYDIINIGWLQRVVQDGNLLDYEQEEVYYLGNNYKNCLADNLDSYGDSYVVETTPEKLKRTFEIIEDMQIVSNQNNTIVFKGFEKHFGRLFAYFDKYQTVDDKNSAVIYNSFLDELEFKYYYGNICDSMSENVNLIIFNGNSERKMELEKYLIETNRGDVEIREKSFIYE